MDWRRVSQKVKRDKMVDFSAEELRSHFREKQPKNMKKRKFNREEDLKLVGLIDELGMDWVELAESFGPDRCPISLRNRYFSGLKNNEEYLRELANEVKERKGENNMLKMNVRDIVLEDEPEWLTVINSLLLKVQSPGN